MLDKIIEPICISCKENKTENFGLCENCLLQAFESAVSNRCRLCSQEIKGEGNICDRCLNNEDRFDRAYSIFPYTDSIRTLVHRIKFKDKKEWLKIINSVDKTRLAEIIEPIDCITYIPSSLFSYMSRGYNVSKEIGKIISAEWNLPLVKMLKPGKIRKKRLSLAKDIHERKKVIRKFLKLNDFHGKKLKILLVDDVFTTGTTINSACRLLKESGKIEKIHVLTLARV